jgi:hypothetical protein
MVKKNYNRPFAFHCITDDGSGIRPEVIIDDIDKHSFFRGTKETMFTIEKLSSFRKGFLDCNGPYVLLDLDILIHGDLTEYLDGCFTEFRLIYNYWQPPNAMITHYGHNYCNINSSFVTWQSDQADYIFQYYKDNMNKISKIYWSLDHSMIYLLEGKYSYHPKNIIYTYNAGAAWPDDIIKGVYREKYKICLFNNSHGVGFDLNEVKGWAKELWIKHDIKEGQF